MPAEIPYQRRTVGSRTDVGGASRRGRCRRNRPHRELQPAFSQCRASVCSVTEDYAPTFERHSEFALFLSRSDFLLETSARRGSGCGDRSRCDALVLQGRGTMHSRARAQTDHLRSGGCHASGMERHMGSPNGVPVLGDSTFYAAAPIEPWSRRHGRCCVAAIRQSFRAGASRRVGEETIAVAASTSDGRKIPGAKGAQCTSKSLGGDIGITVLDNILWRGGNAVRRRFLSGFGTGGSNAWAGGQAPVSEQCSS